MDKIFDYVALIMEITVINANLTYHTVLLFVLPLLYSIKYCNKKFVYCAYILSVLSMYVSGMIGYFWGLCDANMAVLTVHPMSEYYNELTGLMEFGEVNSNPWLTLPLFYVLPRGLILFVLIPLTRNISDGIAKKAVRELNLSRLSEADEMQPYIIGINISRWLRSTIQQYKMLVLYFGMLMI